MQKIVVGYDGSDHSRRALDRAAALGRAGASVTVVAAVPLDVHGPRSMGAQDEDRIAAERDVLDRAREHLKGEGIDAHAVEGEGEAAGVIIAAAEEQGADLIVVGTRGLGIGKRLVLGSVSTKVVHDAPCDVLVVR